MISRKYPKTSDRNKHNISTSTPEKQVSTSKVSTREGRIDVRIPKKSKIYDYLYVDTKGNNIPKWKLLDMIFEQAEQNKEQYAIKVYDMFIECVAELHPDKIEKLNKLRPLIIKHIIKGETLDESYYEMIREL